jgi:hypothetical protein
MMQNRQTLFRAEIERALAGAIRRIATGEVEPRRGLGEVVTTYYRSPEPAAARYVGEEYGIAQLIGYYYGYDDLEERPAEVSFEGRSGASAVAALDAEVVRLAQAWIAARGA